MVEISKTGFGLTVTITSTPSLSQPETGSITVTKTDSGLESTVVKGSKVFAIPANKLAGPGFGLAS